MTALTERIAEVLRAHGQQGWNCTLDAPMCSCGDFGDWRAHVAERITAELQPEQDRQLTEAWQAGFNEGMKRR